MDQAQFATPQYAQSFRCIGSVCEDTCCHGWRVPVDEATYQRYQALPPSPLGTLIRENVGPASESERAKNPSVFAIIRMNAENSCPMLSEDRLCRIQNEYGEALLSYTCATYPRVVHADSGNSITALTLSCPEAARLVLLHPNLLHPNLMETLTASPCGPQPDPASGAQTNANGARTISPLTPWIEPIRDSVLKIAANRHYPLWQRLFLLGIFAKRLDAIAAGEPSLTPDAFLTDFNATVAQGSLRVSLDALPANDLAQMDAVLRLAGLMLHRSNVSPRFVECVNAFTTGIGNGPGATLASLTAHTRTAWERHFAPFFRSHPHILENYLINTILRLNFPFGSAKNADDKERTICQRFAVLAAQFALIRGMLVGVAGHYGEKFSADHVVHTVQAASKHFEHHPEFAKQILALLAELKLDDMQGLTTLLREPAFAQDSNPRRDS